MRISDLPSDWTAWWFILPVVAIGLWVAWSDMKFMKIPNTSVLALAAVFIVIGPIALPFEAWLWGLALGMITLVAGFIISTLRLVGAGDAKFAAAMAPFFTGSSPAFVFTLFAGCLLAAFAAHRLLRLTPFRSATPEWVSWTSRKFPMGLALSGTLIFYFLLGLLISA
ncbi:A24 family peptidase [Tabrizicola sp. M-4]|uniref:A24 family peptidase n=1 Tax=Tabrizicola sp. M-4 TaxID=3055847 RepID=UPI003DA99CC1